MQVSGALRHRRPLLVVGIFAIAIAASAGVLAGTLAEQHRQSSRELLLAAFPPSAAGLATLRSVAIEAASKTGDSTPTSGRVYASSRAVAVQVLDPGAEAGVGSDQPVYVFVLRGEFVATNVPYPPAAKPPSGNSLTLVWDPSTQTVTDLGVDNNEPEPKGLGEGIDLGL